MLDKVRDKMVQRGGIVRVIARDQLKGYGVCVWQGMRSCWKEIFLSF